MIQTDQILNILKKEKIKKSLRGNPRVDIDPTRVSMLKEELKML